MPNEAQMLQYALSLDLKAFIITFVTLAAVGVGIYGLVKKVQDILGIETKTMKQRRLVKESINSLKEEVDQLRLEQNEDKQKMEDIKSCINKLFKINTKKDIGDMRWRILDFANALKNGRTYDSEVYNHILEIYDDYEKLLADNGLENGRADMAMRLIKEHYEKGMHDGFPA